MMFLPHVGCLKIDLVKSHQLSEQVLSLITRANVYCTITKTGTFKDPFPVLLFYDVKNAWCAEIGAKS